MNAILPCALVLFPLLIGNEDWRPAHAPVGSPRAVAMDGVVFGLAAPGGVIALSYELGGEASLGQPLEVRITVSTRHRLKSVTARVYAHDGVIVAPQSLTRTELGPDESVQWTFRVTPYMNGPLRWSLLVQGQARNSIQSGQLTVPVEVGDAQPAPEPAGVRSVDDTGRSIISFAARER